MKPSGDENARKIALDTQHSFIVQAPAGSGKTELLTQRYLNLLAKTVNHPEEVIAITFTRKAAGEMRDRILTALELAAYHPQPTENHKQLTWTLAKEVLTRDEKNSWELLQNPNRLRILTIDALSTWLNGQTPLLSRFGAKSKVAQNPGLLYEQAIDNLIKKPGDLKSCLHTILLHLDNNTPLLVSLLKGLLAKRDQWLWPLMSAYNQLDKLRETLETSLSHLITDVLEKTNQLIPQSDKTTLTKLVRFAANEVAKTKPAHLLCTASDLIAFPETTSDTLPYWKALATLFIGSKNLFRTSIDKRLGFPKEATQEKSEMLALLESYREKKELEANFIEILSLPESTYTNTQWSVLKSLLEILPILCAELTVLFQQTETTDFVELGLGALRALGVDENPTELSLYLDYQIKHLLVDEFQDTSIVQFTLLEKLIQTWDPQEKKTLFLVGDPMQSIYRFRNAEVGLFIRAQQQGIAELSLTPLTLTCNFRATPTLVEWVNKTFLSLFPSEPDIHKGAVNYSPSIAVKSENPNSCVTYLCEKSTRNESLLLQIKKIHTENPTETLAILVKSRSHLRTLIPLLQSENLPYQAIELETLDHRPEVIDLLSLTKALLHLGDRTSWLAVLRAPWCGLTLKDLLVLSQQADTRPLWSVLLKFKTLDKLSEDAKLRLSKLVPLFEAAFHTQGELPLSLWIKGAWQALDGENLLSNDSEKASACRYFELLEEMQYDFDLTRFEEQLKILYANPLSAHDNTIQIMTIHKSKGLEFDHIFLPELQRQPPAEKNELLLWLQQPRLHAEEDLLFAPIKSTQDSKDPLHAYLKKLEKEKLAQESRRVFYVAATRAKKNINSALHR